MSRSLEQNRLESIRIWAQAQRQALHEAVRNTPVAIQQISPAAAAGAGASGGGFLDPALPDFLLGEVYGFYYDNSETSTWWMKIVNFETGSIIDKNLGLSTETVITSSMSNITQDSGFAPVFYDTALNQNIALFIDIQGNIIQSITSGDISWNYISDGLLRTVWDVDDPDGFSIYIFDGKNCSKYSFPGATGWNWGSYADSSTSDLTVPAFIYYPDKTESYLLRRNGVAKNITDIMDFDNYAFICSPFMDFILGVKYDSDLSIYTTVKAINSKGELIAEYDATSFSSTTWDDFTHYGGSSASAFVSFYNSNYFNILNFDGTTFYTYNHVRYDSETETTYYIDRYYNNPYVTNDYESRGSKACFGFYSDVNYSSYNQPTYTWFDYTLVWIGKGLDFQEYSFGSEIAASGYNNDGYYAETPSIHYASGPSENLYTLFLTDEGTTSLFTGYTNDYVTYISSAAFGNSCAYVFDLTDDTRKFYVYNNGAETLSFSPTVYWSWNYSSRGLLLNDDDNTNVTYVLGSDGVTFNMYNNGLTNNYTIYDYTRQYSRDGYATERMALREDLSDPYKIWVLTPSGFIEGGNSNYTNPYDTELGRSVYTNIYYDESYKIEVFSLEDGSLLYTGDTTVSSPSISNYGDRVAFQEGANVYTITKQSLIQNPINGTPHYAFNDMYWYWD